ncbi:MAG: class I SAM-dependent methyltransferase [Thermoanaerobaculales bacterium]|nr:class I SAM-dependent methyltransferase [Thermoanaerobaculales bacterium]
MDDGKPERTDVGRLLREAEALEKRAAVERVDYFDTILGGAPGERLLDVGCGNGYAVEEWRRRGRSAIGVDRSLYRLSRWIGLAQPSGRLVLADAAALPFPDGSFEHVVSSGMIEHVGVSESSEPYTVRTHDDRDEQRRGVVGELIRVAGPAGRVVVDCPNGSFPIDFWHGDRVGAFRLHRVPDTLLPCLGDLRRWAASGGRDARLRPLSGRLAFRQVGRRWWGRVLAPAMRRFLVVLDRLCTLGAGRAVAPFYPYLVVELWRRDEP